MLVNKTVEFFLSEVARREIRGGRRRAWSEMPVVPRLGLDEMPTTKSPGRQRAWSDQGPGEIPAEAEAGTGQDADDQITGAGGGKITGAGGGKINSKENAL